MERLSGLDASFLYLESPTNHMHVAATMTFDPSTIDGVSGANMMVHLFDLEPNPAPKEPPSDWEPEHVPSDAELVGYAVRSRLKRPLQVASIIPKAAQSVVNVVRERRSSDTVNPPAPLTAPRTSFNGAITPHRKVAYGIASLNDVKAVKNAFGTTVNDVVLATVGGGLRRYLQRRGELPDKSLIATVPISVRPPEGEEDTSVGANRVSAMFTSLATDVEDPVERLRKIHEVTKGAKEEHNAVGADMLQSLTEFAAPRLFGLAMRFYSNMKLADRGPVIHNLASSNVPGAPFPLYFAGAKLVSLFPMGPVMEGAGLNITVISYMDDIDIGLMVCRESVPDVWDMAADIEESLAELKKAADAVSNSAG